MKLEGHRFKAGCSVCGLCMWPGESSQPFSGEVDVFCGQMGKLLEQSRVQRPRDRIKANIGGSG